jgi:tetratricopeptide (TPR) repeat protein
VVSLYLAAGTPALAVAAAPPSAAADAALTEGRTAYDRGDYAAAIEHFERAYALAPDPLYLYPWAQAARNAGDCAVAIELYQRFIDSGVAGDARAAAEQNIARCREDLASQPAPAPDPEPVPVATDSPPTPTLPVAPTEVTPRVRPDAWGVALTVTGASAILAATAVLAVAENRRAAQSEAFEYERFDALDTTIDRLHIAGGVTLGVGVALTLGGAIRLALVARRRRPAPPVAIAPAMTPHGGPMLGLSMRMR